MAPASSAALRSAGPTLTARQRLALPGSRHDRLMRVLKWLLPLLAALLLATIIIWPLASVREFSFLLSKDRVAMATERLRVDRAVYRGETRNGDAFRIDAASAVQESSAVPVVELKQLQAQLDGRDGLTMVTAPSGRYFMSDEKLRVDGPIKLTSRTGYKVDSGSVDVDMNKRTLASDQPVKGSIRVGDFRADRLMVDVDARVLVLEGRAHLRINGRRGRGG